MLKFYDAYYFIHYIIQDHSLSSLSDKVKQLSVHEKESKRKDDVISSLRVEIAQLQKELHERSTRYISIFIDMIY